MPSENIEIVNGVYTIKVTAGKNILTTTTVFTK
jgi:hypothetical protein